MDSDEHPWRQQPNSVFGLGVRYFTANGDTSRAGIHLIIDEVNVSFVRIAIFAFQSDEDGQLALLIALDLSLVDRAPNSQNCVFIDVEIYVHRINRHNGRQLRLILVDKVSWRQEIS